jgi:hypothetical protein
MNPEASIRWSDFSGQPGCEIERQLQAFDGGLRAPQGEIEARTKGQKPVTYKDVKSAIEEGRN